MPVDPQARLVVALDLPSAEEALALVDRLEQTCRWFKVGMELYYAAGNDFVHTLRSRGIEVFLDLKLHDIPNTVSRAIRSATQAGASLLTVHASGGAAMLSAAAAAAAAIPGSPRLLAVTVLTSMDARQLQGIGIADTPAGQVLRLGRLAQSCGIDGMVCSAEEISLLRAKLGSDTLLVVPGIRPHGAAAGDQKRIATPMTAIAAGATMLVVGRPITQAPNPAAAAQAILDEIEQAELATR